MNADAPHWVAIVVAAGEGRRLGQNIPKAAVRALDRSLLEWCLTFLGAWPHWNEWILVLHPDLMHWFHTQIQPSLPYQWAIRTCVGGKERYQSTLRGLGLIHTDPTTTFVMVHDAARPLVPFDVIDNLARSLQNGEKAAIPVIPIPDTIKKIADRHIVETVDRTVLVRSQTPQAFRLDVLREAITRIGPHTPVTDEATWLERAGFPVAAVPGHTDLRKITFREDLEWLEWRLKRRNQ